MLLILNLTEADQEKLMDQVCSECKLNGEVFRYFVVPYNDKLGNPIFVMGELAFIFARLHCGRWRMQVH